MRGIKCRVWIKRYNKIFTLDSLKWSDDKLIISANTPNGGLHNVWFDADELDNLSNVIHLMQFTGLFDKNGTPIYEGDIVKYVAGKNYQTIGVVTWADDKNSFNLKTYPLMCAFVIHNEKENKTDKFEWDETDYMEVIGNIYENPTLLESENDNGKYK